MNCVNFARSLIPLVVCFQLLSASPAQSGLEDDCAGVMKSSNASPRVDGELALALKRGLEADSYEILPIQIDTVTGKLFLKEFRTNYGLRLVKQDIQSLAIVRPSKKLRQQPSHPQTHLWLDQISQPKEEVFIVAKTPRGFLLLISGNPNLVDVLNDYWRFYKRQITSILDDAPKSDFRLLVPSSFDDYFYVTQTSLGLTASVYRSELGVRDNGPINPDTVNGNMGLGLAWPWQRREAEGVLNYFLQAKEVSAIIDVASRVRLNPNPEPPNPARMIF